MRSRIKLFPPNPLSSLVFFIQTSSGRVIIFVYFCVFWVTHIMPCLPKYTEPTQAAFWHLDVCTHDRHTQLLLLDIACSSLHIIFPTKKKKKKKKMDRQPHPCPFPSPTTYSTSLCCVLLLEHLVSAADLGDVHGWLQLPLSIFGLFLVWRVAAAGVIKTHQCTSRCREGSVRAGVGQGVMRGMLVVESDQGTWLA